MINALTVVKKQTCPLQTGDVIYVVYRKNEPEHSKGEPAGGRLQAVWWGRPAVAGMLRGESVEADFSCRNVRVSSLLFMDVLGEGSVCPRLGELTLPSEPLAFFKPDQRGHDREPPWQPRRREWGWVRCRIKEICIGGIRPKSRGGGPGWRFWRLYRREQRSDGSTRPSQLGASVSVEEA